MKTASVLLSLPTLVSDQRSVLNLHGVKAAKQGDDIFSTETFVTRFNRHQITILSTGKEKHAFIFHFSKHGFILLSPLD